MKNSFRTGALSIPETHRPKYRLEIARVNPYNKKKEKKQTRFRGGGGGGGECKYGTRVYKVKYKV